MTTARSGAASSSRPAAVVVNHDAGDALVPCVRSLRAEGVADIVVVDNASSDGSTEALLSEVPGVTVVRTGANLGYGAGANRGVAATDTELVLLSNPDVVVHPGGITALEEALEADRSAAFAGPRILDPDGSRYPSARRFPTLIDAAAHALLGLVWPENRFSRRYRMADLEPVRTTAVDWVSGACFLARRQALEELGGFDEAFFMYAEDIDLCWRAHRSGWKVLYAPGAAVTHVQGVSTARRPYRMLLAHHRSAYRFAARTASGWRRATLPGVAAVLAVRMVMACAAQAMGRVRSGARPAD